MRYDVIPGEGDTGVPHSPSEALLPGRRVPVYLQRLLRQYGRGDDELREPRVSGSTEVRDEPRPSEDRQDLQGLRQARRLHVQRRQRDPVNYANVNVVILQHFFHSLSTSYRHNVDVISTSFCEQRRPRHIATLTSSGTATSA